MGRGKRHGIGVANFVVNFLHACDYFNLLKWNLFYCSVIMLSLFLKKNCYQLYYFSSQLLLQFQFLINIIIKRTSKSSYLTNYQFWSGFSVQCCLYQHICFKSISNWYETEGKHIYGMIVGLMVVH